MKSNFNDFEMISSQERESDEDFIMIEHDQTYFSFSEDDGSLSDSNILTVESFFQRENSTSNIEGASPIEETLSSEDTEKIQEENDQISHEHEPDLRSQVEEEVQTENEIEIGAEAEDEAELEAEADEEARIVAEDEADAENIKETDLLGVPEIISDLNNDPSTLREEFYCISEPESESTQENSSKILERSEFEDLKIEPEEAKEKELITTEPVQEVESTEEPKEMIEEIINDVIEEIEEVQEEEIEEEIEEILDENEEFVQEERDSQSFERDNIEKLVNEEEENNQQASFSAIPEEVVEVIDLLLDMSVEENLTESFSAHALAVSETLSAREASDPNKPDPDTLDPDTLKAIDESSGIFERTIDEAVAEVSSVTVDHFIQEESSNMYAIGRFYEFEEVNVPEMLRYYELAAGIGSTEAMVRLGKHYEDAEDLNKAKDLYQMAVDLNYPEASFRMGQIYQKEKDFDMMTLYFQRAIELGNEDAINSMGKHYEEMNDLDKATEFYHLGARKFSSPVSFYYLALLYKRQNNVPKLYESLVLAIKHGSTDAYFELGLYHELETKNYERAFSNYTKVVEASKDKTEKEEIKIKSLYHIAMLSKKTNDFNRMVHSFHQILASNNRLYYSSSANQLGEYLLSQNKQVKAIFYFKKGADFDKCPACNMNLALIHQEKGNYDEMMYHLKEANKMGSVDSFYYLGLYYEQHNINKQEMLRYYEGGTVKNSLKCIEKLATHYADDFHMATYYKHLYEEVSSLQKSEQKKSFI